MSEGVLIQPREWRKLVKRETLWVLEAGINGIHFTHDGQEHYVPPGDRIVDFEDERALFRARDFLDLIGREGWVPTPVAYYDKNGMLVPEMFQVWERRLKVEVAHHITDDGVVHEDLWVERKNFEASHGVRRDAEKLIVHRQQYIEELLADGYQWEEPGQ